MSIPTFGETYSRLCEHIRLAQEDSAMLAHLVNAQDDRELAKMWLRVSENFKRLHHSVTLLAQGRLQ